ncbi:MAG: outer membrane beta-barrel protein [Nitrospirae bacterium]|nr:outer membrane beta-barrel protein [Nitrospirota bacterium]
MKRLIAVVMGIILWFFGIWTMIDTVHAKSIQGRYSIGANVAAVGPVAQNDAGPLGWLELDSSTGFGFTFTRGWGENSAFEISLDRSAHDVTATNLNDPIAEVTMTTLMATLQYRGKAGSPGFSTFFGIGAGYSLNSSEFSSQVKEECRALSVTCSFETDNSVAFHLQGGTDYFFNDDWALSFEGGFTYSKASSNHDLTISNGFTTVTEKGTDDLDLHRFDLRVGVKYYF